MREMRENGRCESMKRVRHRSKVREGTSIDSIVTAPVPDFEWNRSDACVNLSSRHIRPLASTKLSTS